MKRKTKTGIRALGLMVLIILMLPAGICVAECLDCHEIVPEELEKKSVHEPFSEEDCTSCHDEHGDDGELVMTEEGNELCLQCHDSEEEDFAVAHGGMTGFDASCGSCHVSHSSDSPDLLRPDIHDPLARKKCADCHKDGGDLRFQSELLTCLQCHKPQSYKGASIHEPVDSDDCTTCHDPHGSIYPFLLVAPYPVERYMPFGEDIYEICFSCHDTSAFTEEGPDADTGFKDEKYNYHYRHVVKQGISSTGAITREGTTCRNCHLPHAALRQHLIRETLDCGEGVLCLRLGYVINDGVATCTAGCHKAASYPSEE